MEGVLTRSLDIDTRLLIEGGPIVSPNSPLISEFVSKAMFTEPCNGISYTD